MKHFKYLFAALFALSTLSFGVEWEYMQIDKPQLTKIGGLIEYWGNVPMARLNELGTQGWELAACPVDDAKLANYSVHAVSKHCVLKRQKP